MSGTIKLKRSAVANKVPVTSDFTVGELAVNTFDGKLYLRGNNGTDFVSQVGSSPGLLQYTTQFVGVGGAAPVESYEFDNQVNLFVQGALQQLVAWVHVPSAYVAGTQIFMKFNCYTPDTTSTSKFKFQTTSYLSRAGLDAVTRADILYQSTTGDQSITTTANLNTSVSLDITDATGKIGVNSVSANDLIKVVLGRVATSGTDSTVDVRFVPTATQIIFS